MVITEENRKKGRDKGSKTKIGRKKKCIAHLEAIMYRTGKEEKKIKNRFTNNGKKISNIADVFCYIDEVERKQQLKTKNHL